MTEKQGNMPSTNPSNQPKINFQTIEVNIRKIVVIGIIIIALLIGISRYIDSVEASKRVALSEIKLSAKAEKITEITICEGQVKAKYTDGTEKIAIANDANLATTITSKQGWDLNEEKVKILDCKPGVKYDEIFSGILNLLMFGVILFVGFNVLKGLNNSGSKLFGFGESKAKFIFGEKQTITFKDVAGIDEARDELSEIVMFLREPKKFLDNGARIPKGVLMVGAPGTGKTLLARAIAGEAKVPFFLTSGSEFEEMLVGAGASRVRDLFAKAKKAAPSLIFIDEIDAVGKKRGVSMNSSSTEQTLNQILVEMDGFEKTQNVIVIAATNRPDVLDPALLRPGRFDRKVELDLPDLEGREAILKIHAKNKPLDESVDLIKIAKRTIGYSGADLENVLNEAAIQATKKNLKFISQSEIEEASMKVVMGREKKRKRSEREINVVAYHEAGHAVLSRLIKGADPVHKITIIGRGMSGGMTMHMPDDEHILYTKTKFLAEIKVLLGGFIAEKLFMGDVTTGASNDIERVTKIAKNMVEKFGMSEDLGLINYAESEEWGSHSRDLSDDTSKSIDIEIRKIVKACYDESYHLLDTNKALIEKVRLALIEKEVLSADEFNAIV